jgi:hypothetical protein
VSLRELFAHFYVGATFDAKASLVTGLGAAIVSLAQPKSTNR